MPVPIPLFPVLNLGDSYVKGVCAHVCKVQHMFATFGTPPDICANVTTPRRGAKVKLFVRTA